jgi:hypothetical protein
VPRFFFVGSDFDFVGVLIAARLSEPEIATPGVRHGALLSFAGSIGGAASPARFCSIRCGSAFLSLPTCKYGMSFAIPLYSSHFGLTRIDSGAPMWPKMWSDPPGSSPSTSTPSYRIGLISATAACY